MIASIPWYAILGLIAVAVILAAMGWSEWRAEKREKEKAPEAELASDGIPNEWVERYLTAAQKSALQAPSFAAAHLQQARSPDFGAPSPLLPPSDPALKRSAARRPAPKLKKGAPKRRPRK